MPLRQQICFQCSWRLRGVGFRQIRNYAGASTSIPSITTTPAPDYQAIATTSAPILRHASTQPPSHRPPEARKSQLHRHYTSLIRSTPLILVFQHFNLVSQEWTALRRELALSLRRAAPVYMSPVEAEELASSIKLQVIRRGVFEAALRVAEHYRPHPPSSPASDTIELPETRSSLSREAYLAGRPFKNKHPLGPLLAGPVALLTFPSISPVHLQAALSVLTPNRALGFPPPPRKTSPSYWEAECQGAVSKLLLLGAKIDDQVMDASETAWLGGKEMSVGIEGLRAQILAILTSAAGGELVKGLQQAAGGSLWMALEGRRLALEQEGKEAAGADVSEPPTE